MRLEELAHRRPEPGLGYDLRVLLGEDGVELGDSDRLLGRRERLELGGQLGDELLHADGRVLRVGNLGVVGVELDGVGDGEVVGEVAGVVVGAEATDGEDEARGLELLADLRARDRADVDLRATSADPLA